MANTKKYYYIAQGNDRYDERYFEGLDECVQAREALLQISEEVYNSTSIASYRK